MKIIDAYWEKRNLGLDSVEFIFDGTEDIKDISTEVYDNKNYNYQICRVPINCMKIVYFLQEHGFLFSETAFELSVNLQDIAHNFLNEKHKKFRACLHKIFIL